MNIRASGRAALSIAAAIVVCIAGPMRATESAARTSDTAERAATTPAKPIVLNKFIKHRQFKKLSAKTRKSVKFAAKARKTVAAGVAGQSDIEPAMPDSVANANAQLAATDMPAETARTVAAKADDVQKMIAQADAEPLVQTDATLQLVSADQLNDVDRAIGETAAPPETAAPKVGTPTAAIQTAVSTDGTTLDRTSLIGKIFIAFGGLLTLASAARMFIA